VTGLRWEFGSKKCSAGLTSARLSILRHNLILSVVYAFRGRRWLQPKPLNFILNQAMRSLAVGQEMQAARVKELSEEKEAAIAATAKLRTEWDALQVIRMSACMYLYVCIFCN